MSLIYRMLDPDEFDKLRTILAPELIPHPDTASCAVAEDENENIVGVLFLQLALHMEPLVIDSPRVNFTALHDVLYNAVSNDKGLRFYCFSDTELINKMAEHVGMKQLPFKVYEGEVK